VMVEERDAVLASEMIDRHSGSIGTLCLVVRRPGTCVWTTKQMCSSRDVRICEHV
jgi:hypothetical protein